MKVIGQIGYVVPKYEWQKDRIVKKFNTCTCMLDNNILETAPCRLH